MLATEHTPQRARWSVMWVASNGRKTKVVRKDFGDDLASATELYLKAHDAQKKAATLACVNMGFPPPKDLRPRTVKKRGRSRRTGKIKVVEVEFQPLREFNLVGKLWCPYCRKLRPFVYRKTAMLKGIKMEYPRYVCPICQISQRDFNVRYWNPTAVIHMDSSLAAKTRTRRSEPRRRRRR